jgi:hypothetical protein
MVNGKGNSVNSNGAHERKRRLAQLRGMKASSAGSNSHEQQSD